VLVRQQLPLARLGEHGVEERIGHPAPQRTTSDGALYRRRRRR
jgi:hypothetical protein